MVDIWKEREKALENEFVYRQEKELIAKMQKESREKLIRDLSRNRCPKCGEQIEAMVFRGVPLDQCPGCGGVWLGPKDLQLLSEKDHRTWFEKWFHAEPGEKSGTG
jgi:uncharacterized protein